VAEIAVELEASRCLTYHALGLFAAGHNAVREVTEAKLLSQRAAFRVVESAFCLLDGDEEIARVLRDTRRGPIGGGTDEVMKEILGKQLGLWRPALLLGRRARGACEPGISGRRACGACEPGISGRRARGACEPWISIRPAAVLVEVATRRFLAITLLVALHTDSVQDVQKQDRGGGADEHRARRQADPATHGRNHTPRHEQDQGDAVADEVEAERGHGKSKVVSPIGKARR
jgi:hypothetical protein